ncbi:tetratricopeptide repeat protein [Halocola ammonii]
MNRFLIFCFCLTLGLSIFSCDNSSEPQDRKVESLDSLLMKGVLATEKLNFEEAHNHLTSLLAKAEDEQNIRYQILANLNLGALYHHFNAQEEALRYFLESLEIAQVNKANKYLNSIYNNIGIIYQQNGAHEKALDYMQKALELSREEGEAWRVGTNLINLGNTYENTGQTDTAIARYNEAAVIFREMNDSINLSAAVNNVGNILFDNNDLDSALHYYRKAYSLSNDNKQAWYRWEYSLNLGKVLFRIGKLDSAKIYLNQGIDGFQTTDNLSMLIDAHQWLAKVERESGNNASAFDHLQKTFALKDTLLENKTSKWISEIQMNYEFGKKEKELELLKETSERQQTIWTLAASGGLLIVVLLIITMRTSNQNLRQRNVILEQDQEVAKLSIERNEAQKQRLEQEMKTAERVNALERQKLQQEIEFKNRELLGKAMHLVNKNEVFTNLMRTLENWRSKPEAHREKAVSEAINQLKTARNMDQDWETFKLHFEEIHPVFFSRLSEDFPELNSNDLRMCAYLTLNLSSKEIAQIFNITPESVRKRKQRLREKMDVSSDKNLSELLRNLSNR